MLNHYLGSLRSFTDGGLAVWVLDTVLVAKLRQSLLRHCSGRKADYCCCFYNNQVVFQCDCSSKCQHGEGGMSRGGLQEKRWPEQYIICFINTIKPSDSCTSMSEVSGLMFKIVTIYCSGGKHLSKQASWATSLATGTAILYIKKWKTKEKQQNSASGILFFFFFYFFCIVLISKMMTIECITMPQTTTRFTVFF